MNTTLINFEQINKHAEQIATATANIVENLSVLEAQHPTVTESVTQVLANLANAVERGTEFTIMHLDSVSAFLAGVDTLAAALPRATDVERKQNTLRILAAVGVRNGLITANATPIAVLGSRKQEIFQRYNGLVKQYDASVRAGDPHPDKLLPAIRQLQVMIDRAINAATHDLAGVEAV